MTPTRYFEILNKLGIKFDEVINKNGAYSRLRYKRFDYFEKISFSKVFNGGREKMSHTQICLAFKRYLPEAVYSLEKKILSFKTLKGKNIQVLHSNVVDRDKGSYLDMSVHLTLEPHEIVNRRIKYLTGTVRDIEKKGNMLIFKYLDGIFMYEINFSQNVLNNILNYGDDLLEYMAEEIPNPKRVYETKLSAEYSFDYSFFKTKDKDLFINALKKEIWK